MEKTSIQLSEKEQLAREMFMQSINFPQRATKVPLIVVTVGLVGTGKSTVAEELAKYIGAAVIDVDKLRVALRNVGENYNNIRAIAESVLVEAVKKGCNVIVASDFIDPEKRKSLEVQTKKSGIRLEYLRVICDFDIAIGRAVTAKYDSPDDFFAGAETKWEGDAKTHGTILKIREMLRRTPHHYDWINESGGKWVLKKFDFPIFAEIDTSGDFTWKKAVEECAKKLLVE